MSHRAMAGGMGPSREESLDDVASRHHPRDPPGRAYVSGVRGIPVATRLWNHVDRSGSCWEWNGHRDQLGYGRIWSNGKLERAHRVAWRLSAGPIPAGLWVLHHCDNPSCVRPDHLFLGNHMDNVRDRMAKRRPTTPRGSRNPRSKLTESDVRQIRRLASSCSRPELAERFGVTPQAINQIVKRTCWDWLP